MSSLSIFQNPYLYDLAFSYNITSEISFIRHFFLQESDILIPACGTGRYALKLAQEGFKVSAFDYSALMIDYALDYKKHSLIEYYVDDLTIMKKTLEKEQQFQGVLLLNNSLRYVHDFQKMKNHFKHVHPLIEQNGFYLVEAGFNDTEDIIGETSKWRINLDSDEINKTVISSWTAIDYDSIYTKDFAAIKYYKNNKLIEVVTEIQVQLIWKIKTFIEMVCNEGFNLDSIFLANDFSKINLTRANQDNIRLYVLFRKA